MKTSNLTEDKGVTMDSSSNQPQDNIPETQIQERESVEEIYARNFSEPLHIIGFTDYDVQAALFRHQRRALMQSQTPMQTSVDPYNNTNHTNWHLLKYLIKAWAKNMAMDTLTTIGVLLIFGLIIVWALFKD